MVINNIIAYFFIKLEKNNLYLQTYTHQNKTKTNRKKILLHVNTINASRTAGLPGHLLIGDCGPLWAEVFVSCRDRLLSAKAIICLHLPPFTLWAPWLQKCDSHWLAAQIPVSSEEVASCGPWDLVSSLFQPRKGRKL